MNDVRVFTLDEANGLLPSLTRLLTELQKKREEVTAFETQIDALELISDPTAKHSVEELNRLIEKHHQSVAEFYAVVESVHQNGCFLKDVDLGLIDFFSVIEGRMVCLCWRLGEDKVRYWHEVNDGYAGREPLESQP